ncbi:MAG: tetratricopeptide repeat protein [Gemmatimonadota bacterium]|nr:tetratricopeptide repeat protein [Gemmatimonadota bacterium]
MKIRYGLVLAAAFGFGLTGCASGGGGGGGGGNGPTGLAAAMSELSGEEGVPPSETENTNQAQDLLESAEDAEGSEAERLYQNALNAAQAEIDADPENPLGHRLAALAHLGLENYQQAGEHFDRAGELYPLYEMEDVQLREEMWIELYNQGMPLINEGNYEAAAEVFEDANAVYPHRPEAFITLGQLYGQMRRHEDALENLERGVEIVEDADPEELGEETMAAWQDLTSNVPLLRAQILSDAGRFEEAAEIFARLREENPSDVSIAMNLAATRLQTGDEAAAFAIYDEMLEDPALDLGPVQYYQVGVGFYQGSAYERATESFEEAVSANPMDRDGLEMWTRSLQLDSAYTEIPPVAERWAELDPNSQAALLIHAQALNQQGDGAAAGQLVEQIDQLEVTVGELQMLRFNQGGARVTGTVANQQLEAGTQVTLTFTFYTTAGDPMGTVTETISVGEPEMSELFEVEFQSTEQVGGYGYELSVG